MALQQLILQAAAGTDPGRVHQLNQDNVYAYVRPPEKGNARGLFVVADGMGGHQAGEVASHLAVDTLLQELNWFLQSDDAEDTQPRTSILGATVVADSTLLHLQQRLMLAIEQANENIAAYARTNIEKAGNLGTTLTCALLQGDVAIVANIGDSRTYLLRDDKLQQLTEDHSYVAHLVREGQLAPEDVFTHPRRNVITRSLGHKKLDSEVDRWTQRLFPGDQLLLCSDGLWEMVQGEAAIRQLLKESASPQIAVENLLAAANANGGADNIGVVVVWIQGK